MTAPVVSPNTVLANALDHPEDLLTPRILHAKPERIVFIVGTQINGAPHLGTSLVQSLAFAWAARVREHCRIPVSVHFSALDNAPYETVTDETTGHVYQRAYAQAMGGQGIRKLVDTLHRPLLDALSERLAVPYSVETYTTQQATEVFRRTWLRVQPRLDSARFYLAPSTGTVHVRVPCPVPGCGWAEKHAQRTTVQSGPDFATVGAVCLHHGRYQVGIKPEGGAYLDLATLYRNLVKELTPVAPGTLPVMVKGGDWVFGSHLVDGAMLAMGLTAGQLPARLFCPQVITDTGAKLSKSLIRDGGTELPDGAEPWMLDTRQWPGTPAEYAERLLCLNGILMSHPRHFFRWVRFL